MKRFDLDHKVCRMFPASNGAWVKADSVLIVCDLLEEVRKVFTRDNDLPDNLLPRIDHALKVLK